MRWYPYLLTVAILAALAGPTPAGVLFSKRPQPKPSAERVQELLNSVRADLDERKREDAVTELRDFDAATFPQIVPVLIDVLKSDPKANVRLAAVGTLSRLRPVTQSAGQALEAAVSQDASLRVRWQARTSLMSYHMSGYHSAREKDQPKQPTGPVNGKEPVTVFSSKPSPDPMLVPMPPAPPMPPMQSGTVRYPAAPPRFSTALPAAPLVAPGVPITGPRFPSAEPGLNSPPQQPQTTPTFVARPLPRGPAQQQGPVTLNPAPTAEPPLAVPTGPPVTAAPPRTSAPPATTGPAVPDDGPVLAPPNP